VRDGPDRPDHATSADTVRGREYPNGPQSSSVTIVTTVQRQEDASQETFNKEQD